MNKEQRILGAGRGLGLHASRRGLLQAGLAIGTLALGGRAALGQGGGTHAHMPDLGVANMPVVPAMDQPLVEPEVRRSANGELRTSLRCAYAYRDIGGFRLYLRSYEGGLAPTLRMKPGETLKIRLTNDLPPNRDLVPSIPSYPHQFNNTNLHFHGSHASPSGVLTGKVDAGVPSPDDAATPSPRTVEIVPVPAATRRTRVLPVSAMNRSPLLHNVTAAGSYSSAALAGPPSPKYPSVSGAPAIVRAVALATPFDRSIARIT